MTKDRLTGGLLAGIAGGIVMSIIDLILTSFGWVKFPYYDWGLSLVRGAGAATLPEIMVGIIAHLLFAGMTGVFLHILLS